MSNKMSLDLIERYADCELIRFSLQHVERVEWVNDAACRLLGYSRGELLDYGGLPVQQLVHAEDFRKLLSNIRINDAGSCNYSGKCRFLNKDGEEVAVWFRGGLLPRTDGSDSILANLQPF